MQGHLAINARAHVYDFVIDATNFKARKLFYATIGVVLSKDDEML